MSCYLVIGASSAIARACCREWLAASARQGADPPKFFLVGRSREKLEQTGADLLARGAISADWFALDVTDGEAHAAMLRHAAHALGHIDIVLIAHGTLPDQTECERESSTALREFAINGTSVIALLTLLANHMEAQGYGTLAVITSVAGDRGRPSNYLYGSAKAAVSTFCEGLRARLFPSGVHVIDIRPGFVATPMTAGLDLPPLLLSSPERVARRIVRGISRSRDVLYVPAFWALILAIIRWIPRPLFKRIRL